MIKSIWNVYGDLWFTTEQEAIDYCDENDTPKSHISEVPVGFDVDVEKLIDFIYDTF